MTEPDDLEGEMGMVLKFPIERVRAAPAELEEERATILILPTIRIERVEPAADGVYEHSSGEPSSAGPRRRRRTPRN